MHSSFYLTTAIDYANGPPHLGHALEKVGADAIARYQRLKGVPVHFVIGMDEHGQKVAQTALAAGVSPQEWVNGIADAFRSAWASLDISYDDFIRTTEPRHHTAVVEMIRRMEEAGDLYRGTYAGYYCVGCESYKLETELVDGRCPEHPSQEIQWMEEEDWFFRLSRYQEPLMELVEGGEFVRPEARRNEVRRMVEDIKDFSVSRSGLAWGIRWPGNPEDAVYVWIDALTNYLSAAGFPEEGFERIWPADLHVIGKDITRFHCVYWPAMLMSAGIPLPRHVWGHGWMTLGGGKISKSAGVAVSLAEAVERYGADALRYFILREIPWDGDGSFTWERFDERYTSELANDLGNLASRSLSMIAKYRDGVVPDAAGTDLDEATDAAIAQYRDRMEGLLLHEGSAAVLGLVSTANAFVGNRAPWKLAKDPERSAELDQVLASLARALAVSAVLLTPFMPNKMEELWRQLGAPDGPPLLSDLPSLRTAGWTVRKGEILFPRTDLNPTP